MRKLLLAAALLLLTPGIARADITAFLGASPTPETRAAKGLAFGLGLAIVGFEGEYSNINEDVAVGSAQIRTFSFNGLLQTPFPVAGFQFYGTIGGGVYHESLSTQPNGDETNFTSNLGGGVKINLAGPLRLRLDYRVFKLNGSHRYTSVQRWYAGINLKFP